jgi:hypothetical protein
LSKFQGFYFRDFLELTLDICQLAKKERSFL